MRAVTVGTLVVDPPLVNGSGVVDATSPAEEWNLPDAVLGKLGAFVTKTLTREARTGHAQPWAEVFGTGSLVNSAGLPNPGVVAAMDEWRELPGRLGIPVVVSLGGAVAELPALADLVHDAGWAAGIELNLACPNVDGGLVASDPRAVEEVVGRVRARTTLPILAKLTPACGRVGEVARAAVAAGADALTCGNTMPVRAVADDGGVMVGNGFDAGLSGAALHPIALRLVADARATVDVPIVGLGGVDGIAAAQRMRDAGADIVGVGTGAALDPALVSVLRQALLPGP